MERCESSDQDLSGWRPRPNPPRVAIAGRWATLDPLCAHRHGLNLWNALRESESVWSYMAFGPFPSEASFNGWLSRSAALPDPLTFAILDASTGAALGLLSLMQIRPEAGVIEIGQVVFSPALQKTTAATEAVYLCARLVFDDLGYRRFEWKCDARNEASRRAAKRFGFAFEGVFRQHMIVKGRNRDTAWHAMLDRDWTRARTEFERWLAPENFDARGRQLTALARIVA